MLLDAASRMAMASPNRARRAGSSNSGTRVRKASVVSPAGQAAQTVTPASISESSAAQTSNIAIEEPNTAVSAAAAEGGPNKSDIAQEQTATLGPSAAEEATIPFKPDCRQHFNLCMDNICADRTRLVHSCSTAIDTFETVEIGDMKVRKGTDLYTFARGTCLPQLKQCDLAERNRVENEYKIKIQRDLVTSSYTEAMAYVGDEAAKEAADAYWECMAPLCGEDFAECYSVATVERRAPQCVTALAGTARKEAVKKAFYEQLKELQADRCERMGGEVLDGSRKCRVEVVLGLPEMIKVGDGQRGSTGKMLEKLTSGTFLVGETVECSQEYLGAFKVENPNSKRAKEKNKSGWAKFWTGVGQAAGGVASIVVGGLVIGGTNIAAAACTAITFGACAPIFAANAATVPTGLAMISVGAVLLGDGIKRIGAGSADIVDSAILDRMGDRVGACFINGQQVAFINQYFQINFFAE